MIQIKDLQQRYGKKKVLNNINLEIQQGEIFGLLGPNGAGKSTLLSLLATITQPTAGEIHMCGYQVKKNQKKIRELIGYVPQDLALWEKNTVRENMLFWSKLSKHRTSSSDLLQICQAVQIDQKWHEKVSTLSGGMKRKLNIALALIHQPKILLMDEPTVGIDFQSKYEIGQYLKRLSEEGITIIYTTHDMSEILSLCDRIAVLKRGELSYVGSITDLQNHSQSTKSTEEIIYDLIAEPVV